MLSDALDDAELVVVASECDRRYIYGCNGVDALGE